MSRSGPAVELSRAGPGVRVWDPVVRLFHWLVVVGCLLDLAILEEGEAPHRWVGYVVAGALAVRILWGSSAPNRRGSGPSCPHRRYFWAICAIVSPGGPGSIAATIPPAR
ncbi:hypothetical protein ACFQ4K_17450 [Tistrella bauzanensis]